MLLGFVSQEFGQDRAGSAPFWGPQLGNLKTGVTGITSQVWRLSWDLTSPWPLQVAQYLYFLLLL